MSAMSLNIYVLWVIIVVLLILLSYISIKLWWKNTTLPMNLWNQQRVAFVSLMRNPVDLPLWLKYHRNMGIRRFFIRLEDSPSWEEYLRDAPDVVLEIGKSDQTGNNYTSLIDRQKVYVNQTMKNVGNLYDIDWLIHIDADELLHGDINKLTTLSETYKTVKLENAEAIFDEKKQDTCFAAKDFLRCSKGAPCKSYVNGKPAGRTQDPNVTLAGPHDFAYKNEIEGNFRHDMPFEDLHILHFEGCSFGGWVEKYYHLSKNDKKDMPFAYYKESMEAAKEAHKLYKINKMPEPQSFNQNQVYHVYKSIIN